MNIKNNFISIICLGNFNPSILTSKFLSEVCKFEFKEKPKGQATPVIANIEYGNLQFIVELEKLQILERDVSNFYDSKIIDYFEKYLTTLEHTPVFVCGINLNTTITEFNIENINKNLKSRDKIFNILETKKIIMDKKEIMGKDKVGSWIVYNFEYPRGDNTIFHLNFRKKDTVITMNFNYEIRGLREDRTRVKKIGQYFKNLIQKNEKILASFFGGE